MRQGRDHCSDDDVILSKAAKHLEPTRIISLECVPFEEGRVKSVCIIVKFLKVFQGNLGRKEKVPEVFEKAIETICPQMNDNITHHVLEDLECLILPILCKHVSCSPFCLLFLFAAPCHPDICQLEVWMNG